jgi:G3E family GTPase
MTTAAAKYIMIGGFLGAGKSTTVIRLAEYLRERGRRVGLITNDQGAGLVDTELVRWKGFAVEEIADGCFCCRFDTLIDAAKNLTRDTAPEVFIAEPVGSCTDLVAAVTVPLRDLYGELFQIAPLSVLVDPFRAMQALGIDGDGRFSQTVQYIYLKQLEEGHAIVINKRDLLSGEQLARLTAAFEVRYPGRRVFAVSARTGEGLDEWFDWLTSAEQPDGEAMELDYNLYAEGEAMLGWLNASARVTASRPFDGKQLMMFIAREIHTRLVSMGYEVAHLKMALSDDDRTRELAVLNLVRNDFQPEIVMSNLQPLTGGQLTINIRAEAPPEWLRTVTIEAIERRVQTYESLAIELQNLINFRPAPPRPTHRVTNYANEAAAS